MKRLLPLLLLCACNTTMVGQEAPDVGLDPDGDWVLLEFFSPS